MATSTAKISFSAGESPSVDELAGGLPAQPNVLIDAAGAIRMRPGISAWSLFPAVIPNASPVIGIGSWRTVGGTYLVYVCEDRTIWALLAPGYVVALSDASATTKLDGSLRPVFASTRQRLVIAGGGAPQKWEGGALSARLGGSPPNFSHIVYANTRLVGNDSGVSGLIYWSNPAIGGAGTGHETWDTGIDFRDTESRDDPCTGLYANSGELVCLGTETIQMLSPDPSQVFTTARTIDVGWNPPHSYMAFDDGFMGLATRKRVVKSDGRSLSVISAPYIGAQLAAIDDVSDCWGARYSFENYDLGLLTFPGDGRTFCIDKGTGLWTEFRGADGPWMPTSLYYWPTEDVTLVGLSTGQIAMLDPSATTDLGESIVVQQTSTFEDHNTSRQKNCKHARFKFHRGSDVTGGTATATYEYRDAPGAWEAPRKLIIGDSSVREPVVTIDSLGNFRQRQHRITVNGVAWRFAGMELDVEILGN